VKCLYFSEMCHKPIFEQIIKLNIVDIVVKTTQNLKFGDVIMKFESQLINY
jgi:hypothetical protein